MCSMNCLQDSKNIFMYVSIFFYFVLIFSQDTRYFSLLFEFLVECLITASCMSALNVFLIVAYLFIFTAAYCNRFAFVMYVLLSFHD